MKHKGLINSICKEYTLINISKCIWQVVILVLTISLNKSYKVASMILFQILFCDIKSCKKKTRDSNWMSINAYNYRV